MAVHTRQDTLHNVRMIFSYADAFSAIRHAFFFDDARRFRDAISAAMKSAETLRAPTFLIELNPMSSNLFRFELSARRR